MDDTYTRASEPETTWALDDPKWAAYMTGWRAGYLARERDAADRLTPAAADELVLARLGAVLADLRKRDDGAF